MEKDPQDDEEAILNESHERHVTQWQLGWYPQLAVFHLYISEWIKLEEKGTCFYTDLESALYNQTAIIKFIKMVLKTTLNLTSCFPLPDIFKKVIKNIFSLHLHSFYLSYVTYSDNQHLFICKLKKHALAMYSKSSRCHLQLKLCKSIL